MQRALNLSKVIGEPPGGSKCPITEGSVCIFEGLSSQLDLSFIIVRE